ncbi:hypothetical protein ABN09_00500, partial [Morganella morganii]
RREEYRDPEYHFCRDPGDVAVRHLTEIGKIGALGEFIPLRGKHTTTALLLKGQADPADAGKKIDKSESAIIRG